MFRYSLLQKTDERQMVDGLNSLKYDLLNVTKNVLFTKFLIFYEEFNQYVINT